MEHSENYSKNTILNKNLLYRWVGWFFFANTLIFWLIGLRYISWITPDHFSTFNTLHSSIVWAYLIVTWLGYFPLLAFTLGIVVMVFAIIVPYRQIIFIVASLVAASGVALLVIDSIVFQQFHYHLNGIIIKMFLANASDQFFNFSKSEERIAALFFIGLILLEYSFCHWLWAFLLKKTLSRQGARIAFSLSTCLLFSYIMLMLSVSQPSYALLNQQSQAFPLYNNLLANFLPLPNSLKFLETLGENYLVQPEHRIAPLRYPIHPLKYAATPKPLNLVWIVIDSWRFDMLNAEITPHINEFSKQSWNFTQHFSGGNATQPGIFSLFYGLPNSYWTSMLKQHQGPVLIHELLKRHYAMGIFSSAPLFLPAFDETIFSEVNPLQIKTHGDNALQRDRAITHTFKKFIAERNKDKKHFFSFLFYDSAHSYCDIPLLSKPYSSAISKCVRLNRSKDSDPIPYINRYKNALVQVDREIGKTLSTLKQEGMLENTVVLITGDHGQEFNDNGEGYWEHAGNFTRYQLQVPLVIYWPEKTAKIFSHQTNHYDITPTLMKKLLGCTNSAADYSLGKLLSSTTAEPYLLASSYIDFGIVEKDRITTIYPTGNYQVEDVRAHVLSNAKPRISILKQGFNDMEKFFKVAL